MCAASISSFRGEYRFLSNFFPSPVRYEGIPFPTVEHAYQAAKSLDEKTRWEIAELRSPGLAKRWGRTLVLRRDWETVKIGIMTDLVRQKFFRHATLAEQLVATDEAPLVEGNSWNDRFWGVSDGAGQNWLGRILMQIREELQQARLTFV